MIAPHIEQSIVDQAMGVANAGAQKQIVNTALYVLLHRTITVGCPLKDQERDTYLSTFRGSCAKGILLPPNDLCDNACSIPSITTASLDRSDEAVDPSVLVESLSLSEPAKKAVNITDDSAESKQRKNLKNDSDKGKRQTPTSKNNVQKPFLGSPGNTAPRVLRVKAPSTGPATASRTIPKVTSSIIKLSSGRSASLTSSMKSASSSPAKMSTSLHHLRTASPANLGRVASTSKTSNSNK